jgi:hypothetical protein
MADLTDVTAFLATLSASAVYPNGTSQPSVAAMDVRIFEGWPLAEQLDLDLAGQVLVNGVPATRTGGPLANVSIFPMPGATANVYQIQNKTYVVTPPVHGMTVSVDDDVVSVTGEPGPGEFLSILVDRKYAFSATGATAAAILATLATQAAADYSGVVATSTTITVPFVFSLIARVGAPATLARVTHRQKQSIMITVWAPTTAARAALSIAIDGIVKQGIVVTLPDTTQAKITYSRTNQLDQYQNASVYRRDLIYDVEYATIETFQGIEITNVSVAGTPLTKGQSGPTSNTLI